MKKAAKLIFDGETYELPIVEGSEGERALDISALRKESGLITLDPGYANTGSCESRITFMDGEKGILRYRGIPVEQLAEKATFKETAYLLIHGKLPNSQELKRYSMMLNDNSLVHEDMKAFYMKFPRASHPMGILSAMVNALRSFYPELNNQTDEEEVMITMTRLMAKIRTMAAMSYKISRGHKVIYPRPDLTYCENFLNMMFDTPVLPYKMNKSAVKALRVFWILHADHEQNCSTSSVRMVGSARVNLYAAISSGIAALWGPLHGGANQAVIEMLTEIHDSGGNYKKAIERAKDRSDPFRLMGFGHRVYKTYDPRATIMKKMCDDLLESLHISDPLLDIAKELEIQARKDPYFIDHHLYPNVDFFSGIVLRAIGIPTNMFTVMFAIGRLPGWIAQWKESIYDPKWKISRPRQIYIGPKKRDFISIAERN
ncbi:MAG: citrate synthase [Desulfobacterales bacterium]|nr:citrate synthase [Deltaproteobacteria bacterium]NNL42993.1 citrate synthase [Desulfobacterales bacterium]